MNSRLFNVTPVLVFDIETIPDTAGYARLQDLPAATPENEIAEMAMLQRRQATGSDLPIPPRDSA